MGNVPGCCAADREATASVDLYEDDAVKALPLDEDSSDDDDDGAHFSVKHAMELRKQGSEADKEDIQMLLVSPLDKLTNSSTGGILSQNTRKEDSWMKARALGSVLDTKLHESEEKKKLKSSSKGKKVVKTVGGRKNKIPPRKLYVM